MTEEEATKQAQVLLNNPTAMAFYDSHSVIFPYLIGIRTPSGEMGVIACGRSYTEALSKARLWKRMQNRFREPSKNFGA